MASPVPNTYPYTPLDRALPTRPVSPNSLLDAYVTFILYCNPHFDLSINTNTLRTQFLHPPKSDAKEFSTAHLWHLLQKFEAKEIKTWGALATELGVEAPDVSKGQSAQKVQQYTVRLKRWMHAMHIDAFFEYLLGKDHVYFLEVPHPSDPFPAGGRDGVVAEEDTAIRALDPSFRPKRGRRRNSDAEAEEAAGERLKATQSSSAFPGDGGSHSAYPRSAMPMSAHPDGAGHDPWAAASAVATTGGYGSWGGGLLAPQSAVTPSMPAHMRWQRGGATPHPMTALPGGSMAAHIDAAFGGEMEPRSAITPSSKRRRRHGPQVSSAWPSANPPGAKPRGRPPAASKVQDAAFNTFRSAPQPQPQQVGAGAESPGLDATAATPDSPSAIMAPPLPVSQPTSAQPSRPGRLSLQVPQHTGGPVRLATPPPPRVVVSGDSNAIPPPGSTSQTPDPFTQHQPPYPPPYAPPYPPHAQPSHSAPLFPFETLKRTLTTDLLRAELFGRRTRLSGDEAKRLADAILDRLAVPRTPTSDPAKIERENIVRLTAASWLGLGDQLNIPLGPAIGGSAKRVTLTRFRTDAEGYEEIVSADWPGENGEGLREIWDISWTATQGGCTGTFGLNGLVLPNAATGNQPTGKPPGTDIHDLLLTTVVEAARQLGDQAPDEEILRTRVGRNLAQERGSVVAGAGVGSDGVDWKARCLALEFGSRIAHGEMVRLKGRILEEVLDVLLRQ